MYTEVVKGLLLPFFTALGVVVGAAVFGALSTLFYLESPLYRMGKLAYDMKLWAAVVAIGGTFPTIEAIDSGLFRGEIMHLVRQGAIVTAGFLGAQAGYWLILALTGSE